MRQGFLISAILMLAITAGPFISVARSQTAQATFSPAQYSWAINWINGPLETLMAHSVIESISSSDTNFHVRAGEAWAQLLFGQAGEILSNFSRARQITGHSPFFTVEESSTGTVIGRVTQTSITILVTNEGYFEYFPDTNARANTAY
jgi:hypothetical protein